jgi:2-methylisocitrate lyase-like PEP mutase family enzyme
VVAPPKIPTFKALSDCGVKRISMAVLLYKASYNQSGKLAADVKAQQSFEPLF